MTGIMEYGWRNEQEKAKERFEDFKDGEEDD